jgi:Winged helix DNA-binding domain
MSQREQTGMLFGEPTEAVARAADPETSHAAAKSVPVTNLEAQIIYWLRTHREGATTHELSDFLNLPLVTVSPRMRPMARKGLVVDSGERRAWNGSGKSIVWKAAK